MRAGRQLRAIGAERNTVDPTLLFLESEYFVTALRVPDSNDAIFAPGCQLRAIQAEGHAAYSALHAERQNRIARGSVEHQSGRFMVCAHADRIQHGRIGTPTANHLLLGLNATPCTVVPSMGS